MFFNYNNHSRRMFSVYRKKVVSPVASLIFCFLTLFSSPASTVEAAPTAVPEATQGVSACWAPLLARLKADGLHGPDVEFWFAGLGDSFSPDPMGLKIRELFRINFEPKPPLAAPPKPLGLYKGVVSEANIKICRDFLVLHKAIFDSAQSKYKVDRTVLAALLFVETRLGTQMGKNRAFWSLACLAASNKPEVMGQSLADLPMDQDRLAWLQSTLLKRSDWAYGELKALLGHCRGVGADPLGLPGSVYGAIGICQFMPSNISLLGADGDGDGKVDPFNLADAVHSAARYLHLSGWREKLSRPVQMEVIKKYNKSSTYANTVLTLAEKLPEKSVPPAKVSTKSAPKGKKGPAKPAKKAPAKPAPKPAPGTAPEPVSAAPKTR